MNIIFIDVDGVLNPNVWRPGFDKYLMKLAGEEYEVFLSKEHGEWLKNLAVETNSELVWGTTWQQWANKYIGPKIGLPDLPYLDLSDRKFSESLGSIKARAAITYARDSKFAYFDDEHDLGYGLKGSKGLHIPIEPRYGLGREDIDIARTYLLS